MVPDSFARVFGNDNDEEKSANNHQKHTEYKSSAGAISGGTFVAHFPSSLSAMTRTI
jgi:hypothetical protein